MKNSLFNRNTFFKHPGLTSSSRHQIEAGFFSAHQIRELHDTNKQKIIFNIRLSQDASHPSNLSRKKVESALNCFDRELTSGSRGEFGKKAKGAHQLLELINDYTIQTLLTTNSYNHKHDLKDILFKDVNEIRLKCMIKMLDWEQIWHYSLKNMP